MFLVSRCDQFGWLLPGIPQGAEQRGGARAPRVEEAARRRGLRSEPCASGWGLQPRSAGSPAPAAGAVLHPRQPAGPQQPEERN